MVDFRRYLRFHINLKANEKGKMKDVINKNRRFLIILALILIVSNMKSGAFAVARQEEIVCEAVRIPLNIPILNTAEDDVITCLSKGCYIGYEEYGEASALTAQSIYCRSQFEIGQYVAEGTWGAYTTSGDNGCATGASSSLKTIKIAGKDADLKVCKDKVPEGILGQVGKVVKDIAGDSLKHTTTESAGYIGIGIGILAFVLIIAVI